MHAVHVIQQGNTPAVNFIILMVAGEDGEWVIRKKKGLHLCNKINE